MNRKTININVFHFEMTLNNNFSVTIKFFGNRGTKDNEGKRVIVNVTFDWYFLRYLNSKFKVVAQKAQARIDDSGFNGKGE